MIPTLLEEKETTDKEVSSHGESSSQNSGHHVADQGTQLLDVQEQFSDTNLRYKYIGLCAFNVTFCLQTMLK